MRKIGVVASLAATALILAACNTPAAEEPETGNIRVWINGTDTPQEARDYLKQTFEEQNPGWTLTIEEQQWSGLVDLLTTSLSSADSSPDIVEVGNTQAPAFTSAGAFLDLSADFPTDGLLPGFVEIGSYDGRFYAAPYYSGARLVFYNKAMYEAAGVEVPTTLDEYVENVAKLQAAHPGTDGVYWAGQDWYDALPFIWENGGEIAVFEGGQWDAQLSSPESIAGLEQVAAITTAVVVADKNGNETDEWVPFYERRAAAVSAPSWAYWSILYDEENNPNGLKAEEFGYFNLPGKDGGVAQVFAGGSNIAISKNSKYPEQAKKALKIMLSEEYQRILAGAGLVPALTSLSDETAAATPELAELIATAAVNAKLTPASPKWADVEAAGVLQDLFVQIANGGDIEELAAAADAEIEEILNG